MAREDTPGPQRSISEATQLRLSLGQWITCLGAFGGVVAAATGFALDMRFGISDLRRTSIDQATEISELRRTCSTLVDELREVRDYLRRKDHGTGRDDIGFDDTTPRRSTP